MKKTFYILAFAAILTYLIVAGCGGGGGSSDDSSDGGSNDNGRVVTITALSLFAENVKLCTPYLSASSLSSYSSDLSNWNSWNPSASGSVLGKLFDPTNGGEECLHTSIEKLDSHIELINQFSDVWNNSGIQAKGNMTATIVKSVSTVNIPYIDIDVPSFVEIDRVITLSVPDQNLIINMAFSADGNTIVEQYSKGTTEAGAFLVSINGNDIRIWQASVGEKKVQTMWQGNTSEKWFKISLCSDEAGGNFEVMGGGSIADATSKMAFMARNDANNSSEDKYYLSISQSDLDNAVSQTIFNAGTTPPGTSTSELAYIIEGNSDCLGFLGKDQYPSSIDALAWNN